MTDIQHTHVFISWTNLKQDAADRSQTERFADNSFISEGPPPQPLCSELEVDYVSTGHVCKAERQLHYSSDSRSHRSVLESAITFLSDIIFSGRKDTMNINIFIVLNLWFRA